MGSLELHYLAAAFGFIDLILLFTYFAWEALFDLVNTLGLAWWSKVETNTPHVTYMFGPFLTRKGLESSLPAFLNDLSNEIPSSISHTELRACFSEPLTRDQSPSMRPSSDNQDSQGLYESIPRKSSEETNENKFSFKGI